jgi:hypothetical protein
MPGAGTTTPGFNFSKGMTSGGFLPPSTNIERAALHIHVLKAKRVSKLIWPGHPLVIAFAIPLCWPVLVKGFRSFRLGVEFAAEPN